MIVSIKRVAYEGDDHPFKISWENPETGVVLQNMIESLAPECPFVGLGVNSENSYEYINTEEYEFITNTGLFEIVCT